MDRWKAAYPACNIEIELAKAAEYMAANPKKAKKNWQRFLVNWLARCQERGGTTERPVERKTLSWVERKEAELALTRERSCSM
jgi:hypothetical protein